jgi:hypothetical protein
MDFPVLTTGLGKVLGRYNDATVLKKNNNKNIKFYILFLYCVVDFDSLCRVHGVTGRRIAAVCLLNRRNLIMKKIKGKKFDFIILYLKHFSFSIPIIFSAFTFLFTPFSPEIALSPSHDLFSLFHLDPQPFFTVPLYYFPLCPFPSPGNGPRADFTLQLEFQTSLQDAQLVRTRK